MSEADMSRYLAERTHGEPVASSVPTAGPAGPATVRALVVPVDGSALSQAALSAGTRLASRLDAELHLLSAVRTADDLAERRRELASFDLDLPPRRSPDRC